MLYQMIIAYFTLVLFSVTPSLESEGIEVVWRSERVCGLNSVYFLLTLTGHEADYLQMQRSLLKEKLVSLGDIQESAESYGMPVRIALLTPLELRSLHVPVIAHFDTVEVSGFNQGHFVVVFDTDDEGVHYLDGTTAEVFHVPWRKFERAWSGYAVYPSEAVSISWVWAALSLVTGATCGYFVMCRRKTPLKSQQRT